MQDKRTKWPTSADNPALDWFRHLLPKDGLYPAEDVVIYWNLKGNPPLIQDVAVVFYPRKYMEEKNYSDHPAEMMISVCYSKERFYESSGNCNSDWMKYDNKKSPPPHDPETNTNFGFGPNEDFEGLKALGFASSEEEHRAIKEFARIRECQWARDMLFNYVLSSSSLEEMF